MRAERRPVVAYDETPGRLGAAGAARYTRDLRAALARRDDIRIVPLSAPAAGARGRVARLASGVVREAFWYPVAIDLLARRRDADLLHCTGPLVPQRALLPWLVTVHDLLPLGHPDLFTTANARHFRTIVAPALRHADRILTGSHHTRREIIDLVGVDEARVQVTPYGIDSRFRPSPADTPDRRRIGVPDGPFILAVGTLEPRKNLRTLLRAFAEIRRRSVVCSLVVVGASGWRADDIEADLGRAAFGVTRLGRVDDDDLVRLYSSCSCFAFPSLYEGFGFPVLEAMACGAPVVAADRSSLPEIVGDAGLLVDPYDAQALADALEAVLTDSARGGAMRDAGLRRSARYTWERCAEDTVAAYELVAGAR